MTQMQTQLSKKHLFDPLFAGWWANSAHHRVLGEPGQKSIVIKICKKISTQSNSNPWWTELVRKFQPILTALNQLTQIIIDYQIYVLKYL